MEQQKCVMVLDGSLPQGVLANTAAVLGVTLGKRLPHLVGADVFDRKLHDAQVGTAALEHFFP